MYKRLQASKLSDADKPLLKQIEDRANIQNAFKNDINKILEEEKERDLYDEKKINHQDDDPNKKSKRALPKKRKTERDYQKVEQKEE